MDEYTAMEESYKNGYDKGYADAKANTVSIGVLDQVRWERDVAMGQLEEHGIPFCGKAPDVVKVVRCGKCQSFNKQGYEEDNRQQGILELDFGWCPILYRTMQACMFCSYGERREGE